VKAKMIEWQNEPSLESIILPIGDEVAIGRVKEKQ